MAGGCLFKSELATAFLVFEDGLLLLLDDLVSNLDFFFELRVLGFKTAKFAFKALDLGLLLKQFLGSSGRDGCLGSATDI